MWGRLNGSGTAKKCGDECWCRRFPGSGDAQASCHHAKGRPADGKTLEDTNIYSCKGDVEEETLWRIARGQGLETRPPPGKAETVLKVEVIRGGGDGSRNCGGRTEPRREYPQGSTRTLETSTVAKGGQPDGGQGGINRLEVWYCME